MSTNQCQDFMTESVDHAIRHILLLQISKSSKLFIHQSSYDQKFYKVVNMAVAARNHPTTKKRFNIYSEKA